MDRNQLWRLTYDCSAEVATASALLTVGSAFLEDRFMEADTGPLRPIIEENAGSLNALLLEVNAHLKALEKDLQIIEDLAKGDSHRESQKLDA